MTIRDGISRIVSHPRVFEAQTALLGGHRLAAAVLPVATHATQGRSSGTVVDVGGGTASARSLWPDGWTYISLDPDQRVVEFDRTGDTILRLVGDASNLGLADGSVDVVLMKNVSHHLDDSKWVTALSEVRRILRPDGYLVFVDALWSQERWISRLAWALDAGRFPRGYEEIEGAIGRRFDVESVERLMLVHPAIILTGRPR